MKVLMMTDLEGVAGVVSFTNQGYADGKYYEQAKRLLTAEVNAAVEGALAAGAEDIIVIDGHGPEGINFEELHPKARLNHGRPPAPAARRIEYFKECDVSLMIAQHCMAGRASGNLNHTQSSRAVDYYTLNGKPIGEIAQWALFCGALGIPVVFLSGDQEATAEAEALIPGVTTAQVKIGLSRGSAISMSKEASRDLIRRGVENAVRKQASDPVAPLVWPGPFVLEKRFFTSEQADALTGNPRYEMVDAQTVRIRGDDILDIIYA